ncbi:hypothetical protein SAMN05216557_10922 [Sphingomonas carotinifaciens]|nr:hypothetical protein SAMN05216557_10922 [Sphingomonas carotinifaciens]
MEIVQPSRLAELVAAGRGRIWIVASDGTCSQGPTFPLETWLPTFERFADGRWLIVNRVSREGHARLLSPAGDLIDRFHLGNGVEHLAIDSSERIWVGYDDESVPSNNWRVPGQQNAEGGDAVVCFSDGGSPLFLPIWPQEGYGVVDPYAMSVDGAGVWSCPYMYAVEYFPLVRFIPGEPTRWWRNDLKGSLAIATAGDHALLAGGYEHDRLALLSLPGTGAGEQAPVIATWSMPLPPGGSWASERTTLLVGRGDTIHLVQDEIWYRWRVRDLIPT